MGPKQRSSSVAGIRRRSCRLAVSGALVWPLAVAPPAHGGQSEASCPDPTILTGQSPPAVTLICTGHGFPTRSATTLGRLSAALPHPAFAAGGWPAWAAGGFWAPDLEHVGQLYVLYYSARRPRDLRRCIGVAVSRRPNGGFRDVGRPLIDDERDGAIDPALLTVGDELYLFYKRDGNSVGAPSIIFGRPLSLDGLHLAGPKVELLRSRRGGDEHGIIEAPAPIRLGDSTYLLYSQGIFYTPGYTEGEAMRTGDPLGLYRRTGAAPVLHQGGGWAGTGGASIFLDGGRMLLAYAAFRPRDRPFARFLFVRELRLEAGVLRPVGRPRQIPLRSRPAGSAAQDRS